MAYRSMFLILLFFACLTTAFAQTESIIHNFTGGSDGGQPMSGLLLSKGIFYGTTSAGGNAECGVLFKITKKGAEAPLYTFQGSQSDGCAPVSDLVMDSLGNLYGTTIAGGINGEGIVFEVMPTGTETVLCNFAPYFSGRGRVALDAKRQLLYAVDYEEQPNGNPPLWFILRLDLTTNTPDPTWYSFGTNNADPIVPSANLTIDGVGNLWGTTGNGGKSAVGSAFKITPAGTYTDIYSFQNQGDGEGPASVVFYKGNLYGVTSGPNGTVYKLTKNGVHTTLYTFAAGTDQPVGALAFDSLGDIYGVAWTGGDPGSVYELIPAGPPYIFMPLTRFGGPPGDGEDPPGQRLALDSLTNIYGTTTDGGANGFGVVFKITP